MNLQTLYVKPCDYRHYCRENLYGLNHVLKRIPDPKRLKTTGLEINGKVTLDSVSRTSPEGSQMT